MEDIGNEVFHERHRLQPSDAPQAPADADPSHASTSHETSSSPPLSDLIRLVIKCPSLDRDPDILYIEPEQTLREIKERVHLSWPGKPRPQGMRCICSGKLLSDDQTVKSISALCGGPSDTANIHIVVASDGWSEPLAGAGAEAAAQPVASTSSLDPPSGNSARTAAHFRFQTPRTSSYHDRGISDPSDYFGPSTSTKVQSGFHLLHPDWDPRLSDEQSEPLSRLIRLVSTFDETQLSSLRAQFAVAYTSYLALYSHEWKRNFEPTGQGTSSVAGASSEEASDRQLQDKAIEVLEKLLGWEPLSLGLPSGRGEEFTFSRKVVIDGRPYLLRSEIASMTEESRIYMLSLLERTKRIVDLDERLSRIQALQNLQVSASASATAAPAPTPTPTINTSAAAATQANTAGPATIGSSLRPADVVAIMPSLLFLAFKLSILVYVFTRNASQLKAGIVLTLAFAYLFYNGFEMLIRQMRRRLSAAGVTLVVPGRRPSVRPTSAASRPSAAPMEVPPPLDRPQPMYAPERFRSTNPLQGAWWLEQIAYLGMASEDLELGLLPPSARPAPRSDGVIPQPDEHELAVARMRARSTPIFKYALLPLVLFVGTLVPEIEMRRRSAIEEREHVIRIAARLEEERLARIEEAERKAQEQVQNEHDAHVGRDTRSASPAPSASSAAAYTSARAARPEILRNEYSERVLRRRRDASASGLADLQAERDEAVLAERQAQEDADELGAEDDLGFF